jgi:predicted phage terminase large subunit-like protein
MAFYSESDLPFTLSEVTLRIDTAQKGKGNSDHHGLAFIGADRRDANRVYILDADRKRCEFPELITWVADHCERMSKLQTISLRFAQIVIEDANIGSALKAVLAIELKKRGVMVNISMTPSYGSKFQRALEALPYWQSGAILFPGERTRYCADPKREGQFALEVEYATFSEADTHASDDIIDNLNWEIVSRWGGAGSQKFAYGNR